MAPTPSETIRFEVESSLLVNEGGVQCVPLVFARALEGGAGVQLGKAAFLEGARVSGIDPARAAERGSGLVAFVLEDPMDVRRFQPGDVVRLTSES
jgi:hypothetical protein